MVTRVGGWRHQLSRQPKNFFSPARSGTGGYNDYTKDFCCIGSAQPRAERLQYRSSRQNRREAKRTAVWNCYDFRDRGCGCWNPAVPPALPVITEVPQPGPSCQAWAHGETRELLPGQTALGDVEVAGVVRYDVGGSDEGTVVVNLSSSPISVFAEWGAGCIVQTNINELVSNELFNTGCGPSRPCSRVRVVLVTDQGVSETFYTEPLFE